MMNLRIPTPSLLWLIGFLVVQTGRVALTATAVCAPVTLLSCLLAGQPWLWPALIASGLCATIWLVVCLVMALMMLFRS